MDRIPPFQRKRVPKKKLNEYYIFAIAREAENYFKLDEARKERIKDTLVNQLKTEKRKYEKALVSDQFISNSSRTLTNQ